MPCFRALFSMTTPAINHCTFTHILPREPLRRHRDLPLQLTPYYINAIHVFAPLYTPFHTPAIYQLSLCLPSGGGGAAALRRQRHTLTTPHLRAPDTALIPFPTFSMLHARVCSCQASRQSLRVVLQCKTSTPLLKMQCLKCGL